MVSGNTGASGGGLYAGTAYNCLIVSNTAVNYGGGANGTTLYRCSVVSNRTSASTANGGGLHSGKAFSCLLVGNQTRGDGRRRFRAACLSTAPWPSITRGSVNGGGGVRDTACTNTIVYFNQAAGGGTNYSGASSFAYSCALPLPPVGDGNREANPLFVAPETGYGTNHVPGNYRLINGSTVPGHGPSFRLDAARRPVYPPPLDRDGLPPLQAGRSCMGAYEFVPSGTLVKVQ